MTYPLYPELNAWLEKHHAKCIGSGQVWEQRHDLYIFKGRLLIVAMDVNGQGFDMFIPATVLNGSSPSAPDPVAAQFEAIERTYGIHVP